ncbi:unnamed protein product [Medioppia subpectinata]|uniref:ferroxidase n=1 Tax=Medioppia subpectinata TaxID=1979941 RepID=A0A7R9KX94_9ACAR|nr:unnamed protein product [Medioppia subpectinata]CAG2110480.1 unnamed protein product [Medioppia subpectinata]
MRIFWHCVRNLRSNLNNGLVCNAFVARSVTNTRFLGSVSSPVRTLNGLRPRRPSLVAAFSSTTQPMDDLTYERIADHTLDQLTEELEIIVETNDGLKESDVSLSSGVITLSLGLHGVYVINKQSPNKQIWLSSPISGPKRYDYINNEWIYKRDGISLQSLLSSELSF